MNKKEEKLFDSKFDALRGFPFDPSKLKNWITEHDKRERERLIHNILCNISQEDLLRKIFEKKSIPERELSQVDIGVRRSFEMNLHNFIDSCGTVLSYVNEIINKYK